MHSRVYTLQYHVLTEAMPPNIPSHLPLKHLKSLSSLSATKTHTDVHTSPLQITREFVNKFGDFLIEEWLIINHIIGYKLFGGIANLLLPVFTEMK